MRSRRHSPPDDRRDVGTRHSLWKTTSGWLSAFLLTTALAACGLVDSGDDGPDERVMPGLLELASGQTVRDAGGARARMAFTFTVLTVGRSPCFGDYVVTGPHETRVDADGMRAEVRPFDLVRRHRPRRDVACTAELPVIAHEVTVVPPEAGTFTIRVVGRRVGRNRPPSALGEDIVQEVAVSVEPERVPGATSAGPRP